MKITKLILKTTSLFLGMNGGQIYSWGEKKLIFNKCLPNEKLKDIKITINELHKSYRNNLLVFGYGEDQKIYIIKVDSENFTWLKNVIIKYVNNEKTSEYKEINLNK